MGPSLLVLALRFVGIALLYLFVLVVVVVVWRDLVAVARHSGEMQRSSAVSLGRLLVVEAGETDLVPGDSFPIAILTGLGRSMSNSVIIRDPFASTEHALLSRRSGRWWLEDLGSTNGTLLNGERLAAPAIVATGDEIGIGGVRLRIELASG